MTQEDIIRMAREAGSIDSEDVIETVYAAFATAEREACAKVCDDAATRAGWNRDNDISINQTFWTGGKKLAFSCAAAIRARSEK